MTPPLTAPAGGPTVVIADDDADIRNLVTVAARRAGLVIAATEADGAAALTAITELRPGLAILDVAMPEMSGVQVCRAVRASGDLAAVKVMLLSAAVHEEAVTAGIGAGADLYVHKPFSPRSLTEQIRALLAGQQVR